MTKFLICDDVYMFEYEHKAANKAEMYSGQACLGLYCAWTLEPYSGRSVDQSKDGQATIRFYTHMRSLRLGRA